MRSKKAVINSITSLLFELVTIISAFLLPRLVLESFGSATNGITQSVTQFIGYVSLLAAGVGGVTTAALYKPIADKDISKISSIIKATEIFLRKVSKIFIGSLIIFGLIFPLFVIKEFDYIYTFTLVFILGIGTFANYYFGLTYRMVLSADQKQYVYRTIQILVLILHTIASVILINMGATIHIVKLVSAIIFLANPLFVFFYVKRKYKIDENAEPDNTAIKQRWDAFAHQIANFVNNNTDLVVLLIFTDSKEVSVYTVYYLVLNGIIMLINSLMTGSEAAFGNMIAKGEQKALENNLELYEFFLHTISIVLYVSTAFLITSFVDLYTKGITDVSYHRPLFGYLISAIGFFIAVRIPYQAVTRAAGHYRQTRNGAIVEVILNITISLSLVSFLGMVGLAVGTLVATIFRTIQYGIYSSKHIVYRSFKVIVKRYLVSTINIITIIFIVYFIPKVSITNYFNWVINGIIITTIGLFITFIFSIIFYKEDLFNMKNFFLRVFRRTRNNINNKLNKNTKKDVIE